MNKGRVAAWAASLVVATMTSLSSCDHKELCFDHNAPCAKISGACECQLSAGMGGRKGWVAPLD